MSDAGLCYWQTVGQFQQETEMGRYAKDTGGGDFEQAPTGTHIARCIKLIDLGTQHGEYEGKPTIRNQVMMQFELCDELMEDGKPFIIGEFYTNILSEKAKLRAHLESWRGRAFSEEELNGFDLQKVLGKACMVSVIANAKGKSKIGSIAAVPKGMTAPNPKNPVVAFWLDEFDQAEFDKLPKGIQDIINKSDERQNPKGKLPGNLQDMQDDVPFANPYRGRICYVV